MNKIKDKLEEVLNGFYKGMATKKIILIGICVVILIVVVLVYYFTNQKGENADESSFILESDNQFQSQNGTQNEGNSNISGVDGSEEENTSQQEKEQSEEQGKDKNEIQNQSQNQEHGSGQEEGNIAIHITGEVNKTGIIYLNKGARIANAIKEAGGVTKNANIDQVNLAYVLEDGQKIYIPSKKEKIDKGAYIISNSGENVLVEEGKNNSINKNSSSEGAKKKVNINSANASELETLPGIGPSLAQRIIEYREQNGKFHKIEDIQNVKGIGDSKYSNIKDYISI